MKEWSKKNTKNKNSNNRANVVIAIIFLLVGSIIYRLYSLQLVKNDYYITLASGQHEVYSELKPKRGKIFIIEDSEGANAKELYPIATNKDFALLYAMPNNIKKEEAHFIAESLYEKFNKGRVEARAESAAAESLVREHSKLNAAKTVLAEIENNPEKESANMPIEPFRPDPEMVELRKKILVEQDKAKIVGEYLKVITKENDPYEPIARKLEEEKVKELDIQGIDYKLESLRYYPEGNMSSHILGFVGYSGEEQKGRYGIEGFFNEELSGTAGSIKTERDARGEPIVTDKREFKEQVNGSDVILTINRSIQFTACSKLKEHVLKHGSDGGSVIIINPQDGSIIAMCSYPDFDPNNYDEVKNMKVFNNPAIFSQYEPGSVFKPLTMAGSIDQGKVTPATTYKDDGAIMIKGWPKPIKNSDYESFGAHGVVDMNTVLELSLNTGAIFSMERMGSKTFSKYIKDFGFGEKTGIELEGEAGGDIRNITGDKIKEIFAATASFGQGITVTPLQMANSYAVLANGGILMQPFLVKEIIHSDGKRDITEPKQIRRVISERTSALISGMLINVVERGHAKRAQVKGYYVAGKTGTAQVASSGGGYGKDTIHTFIGYAPSNEPRFVMLTKIDHPKDARFAESTAVPLFGEIAEFVLRYYKVPTEREIEEKK